MLKTLSFRRLGNYEGTSISISTPEEEGEHQTIMFLGTLSCCFFFYDTTLLLPGETAAVSAMITETFEIEADLMTRTGI